jgi:hydroxyethylthiazole kinase
VDASIPAADARGAADALAREAGIVVAMTGSVDHVVDATGTTSLAGGHPVMARVTGMGCGATALVAAALAVESSARAAAAAALAWLAVAGEVAAARSHGPGSFRIALLDALHDLDEATLLERAKVTP